MIAWLLEWPASPNQPTRWWNPDTGWMMDANAAMWFARKQDAESYRVSARAMVGDIVSTELVFGLEALASPAPEGWVMVPPSSTWDMQKGAQNIDWPRPNIYGVLEEQDMHVAADQVFAAMLRNLPAPPVTIKAEES